ncbi:MAG: elongation factor P [Victivallales bacterium]|nr:elongation factor P [Victivallales bacterium]
MPYDVSDLHKGVKVQLDGEPYLITEYDFMKPGKGQAIYRCKMRNMITGSTTEKAYRPGDKIDQPDLSEKTIHFSYDEGDGFYVFIDPATNDEIRIDEKTLGRNVYFLEDDMECSVLLFNNRPIEVTLPVFVEKVITETEPGEKGNTATNTLKPAKIENGYEIHVPLFVNQGDVVKIDTRTGEYSERVRKASI